MNTSQIAKQKFDSSEKKENHYNLILKALKDKNLCSRGISEKTGLTQHQISRRTLELQNQGKIEVAEIEKTKHFNQKVNIYGLKS